MGRDPFLSAVLNTAHNDAEMQRARSRRILSGIGTGLVARIVAIASPLLLVPIALSYVGTNAYGAWMAALSLTSMAVFADLGLGQGLLTSLTPLVVKGQMAEARRLVAVTYSCLAVVALTGVSILSLLGQVADPAKWIGVRASSELNLVVLVCLAAFVVNIPLSLVTRVQYATRRVAQAHLWQAIGALSALILAWFSILLDLGVVGVVLAAVSGPVIVNFAASLWLFNREPRLRPSLVCPAREELEALFRLGGGFLALNVVMAAAVNLDVLMVSHTQTALAVVSFGLALRIFSQLGSLVSMVNAPLWPANSEAIAQGDWTWVKRTTNRMTLVSLCAIGSSSAALVLAGPGIFELWAGKNLELDRTLLAGAALYWALVATLSPRFMVQNSAGVLRYQLVGWVAYLVVSVPLKFWLLEQDRMQLLMAASFIVALVTVLPGCLTGYRASQRIDGGRHG
jgi:O-antigen/teichoic acid export membrane protein